MSITKLKLTFIKAVDLFDTDAMEYGKLDPFIALKLYIGGVELEKLHGKTNHLTTNLSLKLFVASDVQCQCLLQLCTNSIQHRIAVLSNKQFYKILLLFCQL